MKRSKYDNEDSVTRAEILSDKWNESRLTTFEYFLTIKLFAKVILLKLLVGIKGSSAEVISSKKESSFSKKSNLFCLRLTHVTAMRSLIPLKSKRQ